MTDLKKLRALAEACEHIKDPSNDFRFAAIDFCLSANPTVIIDLLDRLKSAEDALRFYEPISESFACEKRKIIIDPLGHMAREHLKKWSDTDDTK